MRRFIYIACVFVILGCEKQIPLTQFDFDQKLVLNSFNKVGEGIKMNISESVNVLSNPDANGLTEDMDISIYQNGVEIQNQTVFVQGGDYNTFPPTLMGEEYSVQVKVDDYNTIIATDKIPLYEPELSIDTAFRFGSSYTFKVDLTDHMEREYYLISAFVVGLLVENGDSSEGIFPVNFSSSDRIFATNISTVARKNDFALFNDEIFNGMTRNVSIAIDASEFYHPNFTQDRVRLIVKSISETSYNYYLGILENNHVYGGPLATTVVDNGNVQNGLGLLGFYTEGAAIYTIP